MPNKQPHILQNVMDIIEKVVNKQLKDSTVQTEKSELRNIAIIAVLEASRKTELSESAIGAIAKREIINFKMGGRSNASVPKGSRNYLRKKDRLHCDVEFKDSTTNINHKKESTRIANIVVKDWLKTKDDLTKLVVTKLMDGMTVQGAIREIKEETTFKNVFDVVYGKIVPDISRDLCNLGLVNTKRRKDYGI